MSKHSWKPTTSTHAVWKCEKCGQFGFNPHPLPIDGCTLEEAQASTTINTVGKEEGSK